MKKILSIILSFALLCSSLLFHVAADDLDTGALPVGEPSIVGVSVSLDADVLLGIHVLTTDPDSVSITAVNVVAREFFTTTEYDEWNENEYIFYLTIEPWEMDVEFLFDFTKNFSISDLSYLDGTEIIRDKRIYFDSLPATAKSMSILSYCEELLMTETSDELKALLADLLEYGRQAQRYKGYSQNELLELPDGLQATESAWFDRYGNPCDFGTFCALHYPLDLQSHSVSAGKRLEFGEGEIRFTSKLIVSLTILSQSPSFLQYARMKVNKSVYFVSSGSFSYAFHPLQYQGIAFDLYSTANTTKTNLAWSNFYSPFHCVAALHNEGKELDAHLVPLLEAFYHYSASLEAYVGSLQ